MTTFYNYTSYKTAVKEGQTNIKFESLKTSEFKGNPITHDSGVGSVDSQSGDF